MIAPGMLADALRNRPCYNSFVTLQDPQAVALLAQTGLDFLIIDHEHITMSPDMVANLVMTARAFGMASIVRVRDLSRGAIQHALETGTDGIMVPMIESAEQARQAIEWAKYPPEGTRGLHTLTQAYLLSQSPAHGYGTAAHSYPAESNRRTVVVLQIETAKGLAHRDEICQVPGADVIFIGTSDLSQSLGVTMPSTELDTAIGQIIASVKYAHKAVGIIGPTKVALQVYANQGVNFLTVGADGAYLINGMRTALQ
ncbi:MAG: HpcH/HpaI aldolase family protein [Chloroflexota bacterium]|jgi:4-hydroxy-2-oxoheptanedioate aldolase